MSAPPSLVRYNVTINNVGPAPQGFLDNIPARSYVPLPTTTAAGLAKTRAYYRWKLMTDMLTKEVSPFGLVNITKTGSGLNDNPPTTVSFTVDFHSLAAVKTKDEVNNHSSLKIARIVNPGSGYSVGDILTITGGTPYNGRTMRIRVTRIDTAGGITGADMYEYGYYSVLPVSTVTTVSGGSGSGATVEYVVFDTGTMIGDIAIIRCIARALAYDNQNVTVDVYDPALSGAPPYIRYAERIISTNLDALVPTIASGEAAVTVTRVL